MGPAPPPGSPLGQGSCPVWDCAGHPVQRWAGLHADPSSAGWGGVGCRGMEVWCHQSSQSRGGASLVSVCEIYNLTESGVLLAGEPSQGEPHFDPTQTWACCLRLPRGNKSGRLSTA